MLYKKLVRPIFFLLNPEFAHKFVVTVIDLFFLLPFVRSLVNRIFSVHHKSLERELLGLKFANPIGLAAGFDKNADHYNNLAAFGFSFIEVGTVTPKPQPGNPKPRLFRLVSDHALINRMGFNNKGVNYVKLRLLNRRNPNLIIGGNIGKNTLTPNEKAVDDYLFAFNVLYPYVDYLVVNVSCPNVKDLRLLQELNSLEGILSTLKSARSNFNIYKPILLKLSPDLSNDQLIATVDVAERYEIDGYVATNTSTSRMNLLTPGNRIAKIGNGGLSGKPIAQRATEVIRLIHNHTHGRKPIIGVGGIFTPEDAREKIEAGASLLQVYTGFIYGGPFIVKKINKYLVNHSIY